MRARFCPGPRFYVFWKITEHKRLSLPVEKRAIAEKCATLLNSENPGCEAMVIEYSPKQGQKKLTKARKPRTRVPQRST